MKPHLPPVSAQTRPILLASISPRRRDLLAAMGLEFEVRPSGVDEAEFLAEPPRLMVMKTAAAKAAAVAEAARGEGGVVVAADTTVVFEGEALGKPESRDHARRMLAALSGRTHEVITGLALKSIEDGALWLHAGRTRVVFKPMDAAWIDRYVDSGETDDKAGSYGIQGLGRELIDHIEGELSNVIGLPLALLREGLGQMAGFDPLAAMTERAILLKAYPDLAGAGFFAAYG